MTYKCFDCNINFSHPTKLKRHVDEKHKPKSTKTFDQKETLENHMEQDHKEDVKVENDKEESDGEIIIEEEDDDEIVLDEDEELDDNEPDGIEVEIFKCELCDKVFEQEDLLSHHKVVFHKYTNLRRNPKRQSTRIEEKKSFECGVCNVSFLSNVSLTLHLKSRRHEIAKQNKSKNGKSAPLEAGEVVEILDDDDDNDEIELLDVEEIHKCDICKETFHEKKRLVDHKAEVHGDKVLEKHFQCGSCEERFADDLELKNHIKSEHSNQNSTKYCEICNININSSHWKRHIQGNIHNEFMKMKLRRNAPNLSVQDENNFRCDPCKKSFKNVQELRHHTRTSHNKKLECNGCQKVFDSAKNLEWHMQLFHKEMYLQEIEEEVVDLTENDSAKKIKLEHEANETEAKDEYLIQSSVQCNLCSKVFAQQQQMLYHFYNVHKCHNCEFSGKIHDLLLHKSVHAVKPCDVCGKEFRSDLIEKHTQQYHAGQFVHVCYICDVTFFTVPDYISHNVSVHNGLSTHDCDDSCSRYRLLDMFAKPITRTMPNVHQPKSRSILPKTLPMPKRMPTLPKPMPIPMPKLKPIPVPRYNRRKRGMPAPMVMPPLIPLEDLNLGFT